MGDWLDVTEGPAAGMRLEIGDELAVGRLETAPAELMGDRELSRRHARFWRAAGGQLLVEDLGSANGTFVNHNELLGPARLDPGDELLLGVTVIQVRSRQQVAAQPSAIRAVPPGLATAPREPSYVNPEVVRAEAESASAGVATPQLDKYLDVRVRRRAQLAPLALFVLVALALMIYFATR